MYTFECNCTDYVFDAAWSPIHPAMFACVDGAGRLELWNLNKSLEMATISIEVDSRHALNKLKWSPHNGTEIAVGDDHGNISVYELSDNFANPVENEYESFSKTINMSKKFNQDILNYSS